MYKSNLKLLLNELWMILSTEDLIELAIKAAILALHSANSDVDKERPRFEAYSSRLLAK